jgi:hypothetical protein
MSPRREERLNRARQPPSRRKGRHDDVEPVALASITLIIGPSKPRPGTRIIAGRKLARDPAPRVLFGTCLGPARATAEAYESISPFGSTALRRGCRDRVPFGTGGLGAPVSVR